MLCGLYRSMPRQLDSLPGDPVAPCAQGRPSMFVDMRIVDDAGCALPHDGRAQGELQCRVLHVMREYFRVGIVLGWHPRLDITRPLHRCHTIIPAIPHSPACLSASTARAALGGFVSYKGALAACR